MHEKRCMVGQRMRGEQPTRSGQRPSRTSERGRRGPLAVLAPIPSASVRTAVIAKPGLLVVTCTGCEVEVAVGRTGVSTTVSGLQPLSHSTSFCGVQF